MTPPRGFHPFWTRGIDVLRAVAMGGLLTPSGRQIWMRPEDYRALPRIDPKVAAHVARQSGTGGGRGCGNCGEGGGTL